MLGFMHTFKHLKKPLTLLAAALAISSCASTGPDYQRDRSLTYICYPGSAIKRAVSNDSAYPAWMIRERGSCLYR